MSGDVPEKAEAASLPRRAGQVAQGVVVGVLLVLALFELLAQAGNLTPFKYQGF